MRHLLFAISLLIAISPVSAQPATPATGASHALSVGDLPATWASGEAGAPPGSAGSLVLVVLGAAGGQVAGAAAGVGAGLAYDRLTGADTFMSPRAFYGGWGGSVLGASTGAWLANGRRGNVWLAAGGTALTEYLMVYMLARDDGHLSNKESFVVFFATPALSVALPTAIIRLTDGR